MYEVMLEKQKGYKVPSTVQYLQREFKISQSQRVGIYADAHRRSKDPGPTKYAESPQQTFLKQWSKPAGKFPVGKRVTHFDEVKRHAESVPGPGAYKQARLKHSPLGKLP